MGSRVNGPIFGNAGIWNFHWCEGQRGTQALVTAMNIAGWIPVASLIAGVARLIFAHWLIHRSDAYSQELGRVACVRAALELCQVGFVCLPVDLVCSIIRAIGHKGDSSSSSRIYLEAKALVERRASGKKANALIERAKRLSDREVLVGLSRIYYTDAETYAQQIVECVRSAALMNHPSACRLLGDMYTEGWVSIPKDDALAVEWLTRASNLGDTMGTRFLANMYRDGRVLTIDSVGSVQMAKQLYQEAAAKGDFESKYALGVLLWNEKEKNNAPAESYKEALDWLTSVGDTERRSGVLYYYGRAFEEGLGGFRQDQFIAVESYRASAKLGNTDAQARLSLLTRGERGE